MHRFDDAEAPVGALLAQVSRLLREVIRERFSAAGLHRGQGFVLRRLADQDGLPQHLLADDVHIKPATLTPMLQRLEEAGLVVRKPDPHDQRISLVYLTAAGRDKQEQVKAVLISLDEDLDALFSPSQCEQFRFSLLAVRRSLLEMCPTPHRRCRIDPAPPKRLNETERGL